MSRPAVTMLACLTVVGACGTSHPRPPECVAGFCSEPLTCVVTPTSTTGWCVERCDAGASMRRCANGAACARYLGIGVCWPGGDLSEGAVTTSNTDCAFGLTSRHDFVSEPHRYTCEPVCNTDADCRSGESCGGYTSCDVPCEGPSSVPCAPPHRCVFGFCVNERRFERIDCNHDGVVSAGDPDCRPPLVCDDTAIGGCGFPEPGTE